MRVRVGHSEFGWWATVDRRTDSGGWAGEGIRCASFLDAVKFIARRATRRGAA